MGWAIRLSLFYAAIFAVAGVLMPWWPAWLSARGLSADEIGIVLAAGFWIKPLTSPLGTRWADSLGLRRRPLVLLLVGTTIGYALFHFADGFWMFLGFTILAQAIYAPVLPLGDNLTMTAAAQKDLDYGRMRLWGSVSFIGAVYGAGWLLEGGNPDITHWLVVGGLALTTIVALFVPDIRFPVAKDRKRGALRLLAHPVYRLFLLAVGLNAAAHAVLYGFGTLDWQARGLSDVEIGLLWAEGVVAEIILFAFARQVIARIGPMILMIVGCAAGILRWSVVGFVDTFTALALLQVLHGLTFGATHLGAMHFIQRAAPPDMSASAQGLFAAFGMGIFMGLGALLAGRLYGDFGAHAYVAMAGLSVGATVAALLLNRRFDGKYLAL
ncbi:MULTISPECIES: MFS transporter [unclassified Minwuia]|jgi:MFS transporter, PPP family, 3-phenylpropionic acid transporter|uniref:MFS transporter n=1 Tax=unclassified Minwuia TaxID=2618799 RepID=UPI002478E0BF|nr:MULTISPECIES: MFS transporter [unclassified Minwuia]